MEHSEQEQIPPNEAQPQGAEDAQAGADQGPDFLTEDDVLEVEEFEDDADQPMDDDDEEEDMTEAEGEAGPSGEGQDGQDDAMDMLDNGLDDSVAVTRLHRSEEGAVFCLAVHPFAATLAVSGGEDDSAFVFRTDTGAQLAQLSGHQDSVTSAAWSHDGALVATGGMDGRVRIWKARRPSSDVAWEDAGWEFLIGLEGPDEVNVGPSSFHGSSLYSGVLLTLECPYSGLTGTRKVTSSSPVAPTVPSGSGTVSRDLTETPCIEIRMTDALPHSAFGNHYARPFRPRHAGHMRTLHARRLAPSPEPFRPLSGQALTCQTPLDSQARRSSRLRRTRP